MSTACRSRDYTLERGITFRRTLTLKDAAGVVLDLTGYSVASQIRVRQLPGEIRPRLEDEGDLLLSDFAALASDPETGQVELLLDPADTELLARGSYFYDVLLTYPSGDIRRILRGIFTVEEITTHTP